MKDLAMNSNESNSPLNNGMRILKKIGLCILIVCIIIFYILSFCFLNE
jgi:hypothetical protein